MPWNTLFVQTARPFWVISSSDSLASQWQWTSSEKLTSGRKWPPGSSTEIERWRISIEEQIKLAAFNNIHVFHSLPNALTRPPWQKMVHNWFQEVLTYSAQRCVLIVSLHAWPLCVFTSTELFQQKNDDAPNILLIADLRTHTQTHFLPRVSFTQLGFSKLCHCEEIQFVCLWIVEITRLFRGLHVVFFFTADCLQHRAFDVFT